MISGSPVGGRAFGFQAIDHSLHLFNASSPRPARAWIYIRRISCRADFVGFQPREQGAKRFGKLLACPAKLGQYLLHKTEIHSGLRGENTRQLEFLPEIHIQANVVSSAIAKRD